MRATWKKQREDQGNLWPDTGWFFVQPDGQPWHPAGVSNRFERTIKRSALPPVRLHDLRHCAATYLRHGGADLKEVQETLGHAQLAITADIYTSLILELRTETADAAANLIPPEPPEILGGTAERRCPTFVSPLAQRFKRPPTPVGADERRIHQPVRSPLQTSRGAVPRQLGAEADQRGYR